MRGLDWKSQLSRKYPALRLFVGFHCYGGREGDPEVPFDMVQEA